jgi:hypothetical protein
LDYGIGIFGWAGPGIFLENGFGWIGGYGGDRIGVGCMEDEYATHGKHGCGRDVWRDTEKALDGRREEHTEVLLAMAGKPDRIMFRDAIETGWI